MVKKLLFAAALLSLTLLGGCAKGGSGPCVLNCPAITVIGTSNGLSPIGAAGLNLPISFSLTFQNVSAQPVNWNITGTSCTKPTDSSNPCGYFTSTTTSTANYQGPSSLPSDPDITVVATSQSDGSLSGVLPMSIIPDIANVSPASSDVGAGLTQQYTAIALPDQAPQTFTWTCTTANGPCANFSQDPNISGLTYYKPTVGEECNSCVTISAIATIDPTGCTVDAKDFPCVPSQTTVLSSRLNGTYAFQFSGYDKNGRAIAVAGTFTVAGGSISGIEDENSWNGSAFVTTQYAISGGSYTPANGSNVNSNNAGALQLSISGSPFPNTYQVVLDAAGDIQMVASDGAGANGSGIAESSSKNKFNQGTAATFAFGFTGVDSGNNRVGYVGLLPTNGVSSVSNGLIDVNDNGSANNSVCGSSPCTGLSGSYTFSSSTNLGQLTLTSPKAMTFDFFVANGTTNASSPLTLYAISTDNNPAVVGTMTLQDSKVSTYNTTAFTGNSVSALTGTNGNVALVNGTTDGQGDFTGTFDWNNRGAITSVPPSNNCKAPTVCVFGNTYAATNNNTGRYTFQMLGNPNASPVAAPISFILYASGANRGFLLDQSSSAVITGTMNLQTGLKQNLGSFSPTEASGTYAVATNSNSVPNASMCSGLTSCYATMNLLLTSPGSAVFNVSGVENPNSQTIKAVYTLQSAGIGTIGPISPATAPNFVIYAVTQTDFFMMELDPGVISPILFMAQ